MRVFRLLEEYNRDDIIRIMDNKIIEYSSQGKSTLQFELFKEALSSISFEKLKRKYNISSTRFDDIISNCINICHNILGNKFKDEDSIRNLNLSGRAYNALARGKKTSIKDLQEFYGSGGSLVNKLDGIGVKCDEEIKAKVMGYSYESPIKESDRIAGFYIVVDTDTGLYKYANHQWGTNIKGAYLFRSLNSVQKYCGDEPNLKYYELDFSIKS